MLNSKLYTLLSFERAFAKCCKRNDKFRMQPSGGEIKRKERKKKRKNENIRTKGTKKRKIKIYREKKKFYGPNIDMKE